MRKPYLILLALILFGQQLIAQTMDKDYERRLKSLYSFTVPLMKVDALEQKLARNEPVVLLDTREIEEYKVSHLPNAIFIEYKKFSGQEVRALNRDIPVVVYCSVGYRSEKIGEQLKEMGFRQVYNLWGGIFEWVNQGNEVVTPEGKSTTKVHTYNKSWSKWLLRGEKVY